MGEDKCFLDYHGRAQCYHMYGMLEQFCVGTFISCSTRQLRLIKTEYQTLEDDKLFEGRGPATGVMTAFSNYPDRDFLVVGCDYPLLGENEIHHFLKSIPGEATAAAFYDEERYQPVLAWYSAKSGPRLLKSSMPLKQFLVSENAYRHSPLNRLSIKSIDTSQERDSIMQATNVNH